MARTPAFNIPAAVTGLSAALIAIHVGRRLLGAAADEWIILAFAFIPLRYGGFAESLPGGWGACLWSPITHALLHADAAHLVVNLVWMASFGGALARRFGSSRFLLLALVAAIAGAAMHYSMRPGDPGLMIGASGAVSGMMAATARFAFSPGGPLAGNRSPSAYVMPAEPLATVLKTTRALGFVLIWFAVNLLFGLAGDLLPGASGPIAWEAHVGGFLAGLLLFPLFDPIGRRPTGAGREPDGAPPDAASDERLES